MPVRTNTAVWIKKYKRWQIKVQKDCVRRTFTSSLSGRAGQAAANKAADDWLAGAQPGNVRGRVRDIWVKYIADVESRSSYSNLAKIKSIGSAYILPLIGSRRVSDLTLGDFKSLANRAYKHGSFSTRKGGLKPGEALSRKTMLNIIYVCKNFMAYCRDDEGINTPVLDKLIPPAGARYKGKNILQPDALHILFASDLTRYYGHTVHDEYIYAYRFIAASGVRPGELIGLCWGAASENCTRIDIRRAINVYGEVTRGKNGNAIRSIDLSDFASDALKSQKAEFPPISPLDPIFNINCEQTLRKRWKVYCEANNIPYVSLYELRHTFVSVVSLLPAGEVKSIVGHSKSMDTFGVYGHAIASYRSKVSKDVTDIFTALLETSETSTI